MGREENGTVLGKLPQESAKCSLLHRVEPRSRLIKNEYGWIMNKRSSEGDPLAIPPGKLPDDPAGHTVKSALAKNLLNSAPANTPIQTRPKPQILGHTKLITGRGSIWQPAKHRMGRSRI
jgi:hypothetical protein